MVERLWGRVEALRNWGLRGGEGQNLYGLLVVFMVNILDVGSCHAFVTTRMGDSCAQGGKPGIKETGTSEDVPRTAAITHACRHKKSACNRDGGAVAP